MSTVRGKTGQIILTFLRRAYFFLIFFNIAFWLSSCSAQVTLIKPAFIDSALLSRYELISKIPLPFPAQDVIWQTKASLNTPRFFLGAAALGRKIYAVGGYDHMLSWLATVEEYDPGTNSWKQKTLLQTPRSGLGLVAASNGRIYALGGSNQAGTLSLATIEEYDPQMNTWTPKSSMPVPTSYMGAAASGDGKIYVVGGFDLLTDSNLATLQKYDVITDTWELLPPMPSARHDLAAVIGANGKLYAIGGIGEAGKELATVEEYDPVSRTWTTKIQCLQVGIAWRRWQGLTEKSMPSEGFAAAPA
ncbi:MAG: Kelch repeat-containing protein [Desulfobaccales bacterium]